MLTIQLVSFEHFPWDFQSFYGANLLLVQCYIYYNYVITAAFYGNEVYYTIG